MNAAALVLSVQVLLMPNIVQWASSVQEESFKHGPFPQAISGGFGAGKTWAACLRALWLSTTFPKNRGVIARRVSKELKATTMATFYKVCAPSRYARGHRNDQDGRLILNNSSEILFLHFEDPETQAMLRGLEVNWFLIDQAEEAPEVMEEVFDILLARLSRWDPAEVPQRLLDQCKAEGREWPYVNPETRKPMPPPYAMLCCNPDIELHWIYRRFHPESAERRQKKLPELDLTTGQPTGRLLSYEDLGYQMFHMPSLDNRFLPDANKQALLAHDAAFVKRYVRGEWGLPEGAIHVIDNLSLIEGSPDIVQWIRQTCTLFRSLDYGDTAPTCCLWWATDQAGNLYFYREYYLPNALVSTHRENISALSEGERYDLDLADPSMFYQFPQKKGGRWSAADEYADVTQYPRATAIFWKPADNNELGTRNRINEYLRVDPERIHPITKERGAPRVFFVKASESYPQGCYHVLRETRSQRRVKIGTDLGRPVFSDERDPAVVDHAYDCLRYAVASRAPMPSPAPKDTTGTFFAAQRELAKWNKKYGAGR